MPKAPPAWFSGLRGAETHAAGSCGMGFSATAVQNPCRSPHRHARMPPVDMWGARVAGPAVPRAAPARYGGAISPPARHGGAKTRRFGRKPRHGGVPSRHVRHGRGALDAGRLPWPRPGVTPEAPDQSDGGRGGTEGPDHWDKSVRVLGHGCWDSLAPLAEPRPPWGKAPRSRNHSVSKGLPAILGPTPGRIISYQSSRN